MTNQEVPTTLPASPDHRYLFSGRVHPERYDWHFGVPLSYEAPDLRVTMSLFHSQLVVEAVIQDELPLLNLKNIVVNLAESAVNAFGFAWAAAIEVEMISCQDPTGQVTVFNSAFDGLRSHDGILHESEIEKFHLLRQAAAQNIAVRAALSDISQALRSPTDTLFYCYRAIESIRQQYLIGDAPDVKRARRESWDAMKDALNIEDSELRWLEDLATPRRHGELSDVTEEDRRKALRLARRAVLAHAGAERDAAQRIAEGGLVPQPDQTGETE